MPNTIGTFGFGPGSTGSEISNFGYPQGSTPPPPVTTKGQFKVFPTQPQRYMLLASGLNNVNAQFVFNALGVFLTDTSTSIIVTLIDGTVLPAFTAPFAGFGYVTPQIASVFVSGGVGAYLAVA